MRNGAELDIAPRQVRAWWQRHGQRLSRTLVAALAVVFGVAPTARPANVGTPAPAFTLPALGNGTRVALDQFRGKVVFVDFWASWCGPCRQSLPLYEKLRAEFATAPFVILAVDVDENDADAQAFLRRHPVHYTILRDPGGSAPKAFGVVGMPSSYLIDRNGVIRLTHIGFEPKDIDNLRARIRRLLEHGDAT
ncbi:MAG: TlpA disulfide reductase family protein [Rudaea sp.]